MTETSVGADNAISTGLPGLDKIVDGLRLGDNVVWRVDSLDDFASVVEPFVARSRSDGRELVHVRFGRRPPLEGMSTIDLDPSQGFELFTIALHEALTTIGPHAFYVFDPLVDLHRFWHSDLLVMNFFKVTCPYLFELDTIAYFALLRDQHTSATVAAIRDTTQLLLDLVCIDDELYVHPLKVWQRHSPTMFFPHRLSGGHAISVTSSATTAHLFSRLTRPTAPLDPWQRWTERAWESLNSAPRQQEESRQKLVEMLIGERGRLTELCRRHLTLTDLLLVASRLVGTGSIGGKAIGMLAARAILEHDPDERFAEVLEPHDSHYVGSDLFISFLVINGWWPLWAKHRQEGFGPAAQQLHELIPTGEFPWQARMAFVELLEYFGQAPIIVRSSSLLEDNYGNAFAGKYESVFLTNQGDPDQRLAEFENAIRTVYASIVSEPALRYRLDRGLSEQNEQMAVLVQRVSGDQHGDLFFPDAAGVANSTSVYTWAPELADQGMTRLVVGLGTRAVDRTGRDFARIVALAAPHQSPMSGDDIGRYSQRRVDVLDLTNGAQLTLPVDALRQSAPELPWRLLTSPYLAAARRMHELGRAGPVPEIVDFNGLLETGFPVVLREVLHTLQQAYDHPVDIEYTVHAGGDRLQLNVVQCRPLQSTRSGRPGPLPEPRPGRLLLTTPTFMAGNTALPLDLVVSVDPSRYLGLGNEDRYRVARAIGVLNRALGARSALLIGPGRWGTSTPSLGVPTHFTDLNQFAALIETTYAQGGFRPELSYGSHFFQELVESGIIYGAIQESRREALFDASVLTQLPNRHGELNPDAGDLVEVIRVLTTPGLMLYSDLASQRLIIQFDPES